MTTMTPRPTLSPEHLTVIEASATLRAFADVLDAEQAGSERADDLLSYLAVELRRISMALWETVP